MPYRGRFAPSPTGPLHAGSLVAALASWLDARAHAGQWLVRIEDVDMPRCQPGADRLIFSQLARCGLQPDAPVVWQSQRGSIYQRALELLIANGRAYPCTCSRKDIEQALAARGIVHARGAELPYPGTCRPENGGPRKATEQAAHVWRLRVDGANSAPGQPEPASVVRWVDRRLGSKQQDVAQAVGDFVLKRADGLWAYQLAVVVDDAAQGISHVVRGEDLADNTPRQIVLQQALGLPQPAYLHTPLVLGADGQKLSKQNGAQALELNDPLQTLTAAARQLSLPPPAASAMAADALASWTRQWAALWAA